MQIFAEYTGNFCAGYFLSSKAMEATPSNVVSEESDDLSASSSSQPPVLQTRHPQKKVGVYFGLAEG